MSSLNDKKRENKIKELLKTTNALRLSYESITHSKKQKKIRLFRSNELKILTEEEFEFLKRTDSFKRRLRDGETINDIMPEALALCREATKRRLGMFHYDVQIEAAIAMHDNTIIEMKSGEGKTLVQILSAYLSALEATSSLDPNEHKQVHIITANDYLAERDYEDNKKVFELLGLSCGYAMSQGQTKGNPKLLDKKREAYKSDIIFATAPTIAFDYLEDNHALSADKRFMKKPLFKAIVDEADDILLDQATRPLILSKRVQENEKHKYNDLEIYDWAVRFINGEKGYRRKPITVKVFNQYEKNKNDSYTEDCAIYLDNQFVDMQNITQEIYGDNPDLTDPNVAEELFFKSQAVIQCLLAEYYFKEGKQYQIFEDKTAEDDEYTYMKIMLTDASTGRSLEQTKYQNGIHEAIEATVSYKLEQKNKKDKTKYKLRFSNKNKPVAKVTYPDFLSIYENGVSGMTGTADKDEFMEVYQLDTYFVPTRKPNIRKDEPDELYATEKDKFNAILREVLECQRTMQPVLIGTTNVEESDRLCKVLYQYGIRFQRLDAVNKDNEKGIKETAGLLGTVTIATNMAGRGIDIKLGPGVEEVGGLYVIGSSKNKNQRIDNQLKGRASRQGEPGKTKYFMSLDDELVRLRYGKKGLENLKKQYEGITGQITDKLTLKLVNDCQSNDESRVKEQRKHTEELEAKVYTKHKKIIYDQRVKILTSSDKELIEIINKMIVSYTNSLFEQKSSYDQILSKLGHLIKIEECYDEKEEIFKNNIINSLNRQFSYSSQLKTEKYLQVTRRKMLKIIDDYWISHIEKLQSNWDNATYYAYSNVNPMDIYERESMMDLQNMTYYIQNEMLTYALKPELAYGVYEVKENIEEKGAIL